MGNKNTILIVDDAKHNILYLNHLLSVDYIIYTSRNAKDAIERANEYCPDLILLDIVMPDMSGYEVLAALKNSNKTKHIPVIFITGLSGEADEMKGLDSGAEDYITKPFNASVVKLRIRNQIKIVNQMRALDKRLEQQKLMTSIAQCFLADEPTNALFAKTLRMIGEFMEISQALLYLLVDGGTRLACRNEWIEPGLKLDTRIGSTFDLAAPMLSFKNRLNTSGEMCLHSNDPITKAAIAPYRVNFQNYIIVPIFIKRELCAVLDFSREDETREWNDSEISLACLVASIFSGVLEREAVEYDLNTVLKLKAELTVEKDRAEQSSRAKSEFLANVSHEILTPMNAIIGFTKLLRETELNSHQDDFVAKTDAAAKSLLHLISGILDFSRLDSSKLELSAQDFDLQNVLKNTADLAAGQIRQKGLEFTVQVDPNAPVGLVGDEYRLLQCLNNLIDNAVKFTEQGGITLTVDLAKETPDGVMLRFLVRDTGIGIEHQHLETLFDPFMQADGSATRRYGGTGLGLAISKKLVDLMKGEIWCQSAPGRGSSFGFTACFGRHNRAKRLMTRRRETSRYLAGAKILLVEDNEVNQMVAKKILLKAGVEVSVANNGQEALDMIKAGRPFDLVLMDIQMPVMDGLTAAREIRRLDNDLPIVALTAHSQPEDREKSFSAGMNDHLTKPLDTSGLFYCLDKFIKTGPGGPAA